MDWLRCLRPKQWVKNVFVFAPLLLTLSFQKPDLVARALVAFLAMSLVSSATYIVNDLLDRERDTHHPKKKHRPIAAGRVSPGSAMALAIVCAAAGFAGAAWLGIGSVIVIGLYLLLQVLYNGGVKRIPVADVFVLASGFVLRAVLGAVAIDVGVSVWLFFCTGSIALLLGFGKRRSEFLAEGVDTSRTREALKGYTLPALDVLLVLSAAATVASFGLYSIESETARAHKLLAISAPFVFYGVARYLMLAFGQNEGQEPENLVLGDPHLILTFVLFTIAVLIALTQPAPPFLQ